MSSRLSEIESRTAAARQLETVIGPMPAQERASVTDLYTVRRQRQRQSSNRRPPLESPLHGY